MAFIWKYLRKYRGILFGALILAAINQIFSLLDPQIFRLIIDNYASKAGTLPHAEFLTGVSLLILASMGVAFVSRVAKNFQDYYANVITQRVGAEMYGMSVAHSFSLPYAVFEDQRSGELLQKMQKARNDVQIFITTFINVVFFSFIGILFVLVYALTVHWLVGLVYFLLIPVLGTITYLITRKIKAAQKAIVRETAELAGSTTETLRNVELVKSLGLEQQEIKRLNAVNTNILGLELKKVRLIRKMSFTQGTLINAMRSGLLFLMLYLVFTGRMTLGQFFTLYIYSFFIFAPLGELGNMTAQFQEAKASVEQLEEILKIPSEPQPANPRRFDSLQKIDFQKVSFTYSSADRPAVKDISLTIAGGETIAFVGPSGSGKSTLVKLMVGLYQPTEGTLSFNDIDILTLDREYFRRRIGLVSQETQLFAGTIRENLLFVRPDASDKDCLHALNLAAALPIIERGGKGLDTKIGEGGIKISGGERQRLAIARALLRNPDLIIFDEATSSLDSLTEKEITKTIRDIEASRNNVITVLIAHRLSTISHAKRIYVLEKGEIVETGTHAELLEKRGLYYAMWREQTAEAER